MREPRRRCARVLSEAWSDDRPSLVLVHGLASAASFWANVRAELETDFDLIVPDLPGHGAAARRPSKEQARPRALARELITTLRAQGVTCPHLVGLSLGGWVLLEMASLGYGASVVALGPAGLWTPGARIPQELADRALRRVLIPLTPLLPVLCRSGLGKHLGLRGNVTHPERVTTGQFLVAARALVQARGYAVCDRAMVHDRFEAGAAITVPLTVAFGDQDGVLPRDTSQDRSLLPASTGFETIAGSRHVISWDRPDVCIRLIRETTQAAESVEERAQGPGIQR